MLIDISGVILVPGNGGMDCTGNGESFDENGNLIACCCDECDYAMCCYKDDWYEDCWECDEDGCPRHL